MSSKPEGNQSQHQPVEIIKARLEPYHPSFSDDDDDDVDPVPEPGRDVPVAVDVGVLVLVIKVVTVPPWPALKPAAAQ